MPDLPRPDVTTTTGTDHVDVVISRDGKATSHRGEGTTETARTTDVVKKILNDRRSLEWLPR